MNSGLTGSLATAPLRANSFRRINKQARFSDQATWTSGLGSLTNILGPSDQTFRIAGGNPIRSGATEAGRGVTITASNAIAGTVTAGSAAGGSIALTGGNAASFTSGSGDGGAITLTGGTAIGGSGTGGAINLIGGQGVSGSSVCGRVNITGGGGLASSHSGDVVITGGSSVSGAFHPGAVIISGGAYIGSAGSYNGVLGGAVLISTQTSSGNSTGSAPKISLTAGNGGSTPNPSNTSGGGGSIENIAGNGGVESGTGGTGGNGGDLTYTSGTGGAATGASGTRTGGNGGGITFTTGNGGAGSTTNGNSGSFTISTGTAGAGVGSAGTIGSIIFRPGGTTKLTVASTGVILADATAYAVLCGGTSTTTPLQSVASVGTAGQVLTSNGAGALPTFEPPSSTFTSPVIFPAFTIAAGASQIPAAASWPYGRCFVTDSNQTLTAGIGTNAAGGGTDKVPVWSDGSNWIIG